MAMALEHWTPAKGPRGAQQVEVSEPECVVLVPQGLLGPVQRMAAAEAGADSHGGVDGRDWMWMPEEGDGSGADWVQCMAVRIHAGRDGDVHEWRPAEMGWLEAADAAREAAVGGVNAPIACESLEVEMVLRGSASGKVWRVRERVGALPVNLYGTGGPGRVGMQYSMLVDATLDEVGRRVRRARLEGRMAQALDVDAAGSREVREALAVWLAEPGDAWAGVRRRVGDEVANAMRATGAGRDLDVTVRWRGGAMTVEVMPTRRAKVAQTPASDLLATCLERGRCVPLAELCARHGRQAVPVQAVYKALAGEERSSGMRTPGAGLALDPPGDAHDAMALLALSAWGTKLGRWWRAASGLALQDAMAALPVPPDLFTEENPLVPFGDAEIKARWGVEPVLVDQALAEMEAAR